MIYALRAFLLAHGYTNVFVDVMPALDVQLDAIYLGKWDHTVSEICDGSGVQYVQIQVRRADPEDAYSACNAIFKLLDSGLNEDIIQLTEDKWCIARPRRGAVNLDGTDRYTTYYCEIALWGEN